MSTSRTLARLKKTKLSHDHFFHSLPCKQRAAHIRDSAVKAMEEQDTREVIKRYYQSGQNQDLSCAEALNDVIKFFILILLWQENAKGIYRSNNEPAETVSDVALHYTLMITFAGLSIMMIALLGRGYVNSSNWSQYKETKKGCEDWLKQTHGENADTIEDTLSRLLSGNNCNEVKDSSIKLA